MGKKNTAERGANGVGTRFGRFPKDDNQSNGSAWRHLISSAKTI